MYAGVPTIIGPPKEQPENAWITAGPAFVAVGGGIRVLVGRVAMTFALKPELAFGGSAGTLFGVAAEVGIQFGM